MSSLLATESLPRHREAISAPARPKIAPEEAGGNYDHISIHTGDAAGHTGQNVESQEGPVAIEFLRKSPQLIKTPHVDRDVNNADMDKNRSQQTPPLPRESKRRVVAAPLQNLFAGGLEQGHACRPHQKKDQEIDSNQSRCRRDAESIFSDCGRNRLGRVNHVSTGVVMSLGQNAWLTQPRIPPTPIGSRIVDLKARRSVEGGAP